MKNNFYPSFIIMLMFGFIINLTSCMSGSNNDTPRADEDETDSRVAEAPDVSYNKELTDVAMFISGLPVDSGSALFELSQSQQWLTYSKSMDQKWTAFFTDVDNNIRPFIENDLGDVTQGVKTLFYPFSGPDFINANVFFPGMTEYIFFGLEPPGSLPDPLQWNEENRKSYYKMYEQSIYHIIHVSFFRTHSMRDDLNSMEVDGVTPILMIFLARSGKNIIDIKPFRFAEDGSLSYDSIFNNFKPGQKFKKGVEITFRNENDPKVQKLVYFSIDISDNYLKKNDEVMTYLNNIDSTCAVYIKSASYLLHDPYFDIIRQLILDKAMLILQDDSGMPFRHLETGKWETSVFGSYDKPISLFSKYYQKDLHDAYQLNGNTDLPFRRGYAKKTNLQLARKKQG